LLVFSPAVMVVSDSISLGSPFKVDGVFPLDRFVVVT